MEFSEIIKTGEAEGREKHVPTITMDKGHKEGVDIVRVVVVQRSPTPTQWSTILSGSSFTGSRRIPIRSSA